jgi:hypothetical protein
MLSRFVFLTGGAFTPRAREFLDRLPGRHLEKPFDRDAMLALVASYVGRASAEAVSSRGPAES